MALTGLQIQKLLPGTNCKECGSNTCLAFAMKLAAKKAAITECPYASDDAKQTLGLANEPPVKTIALGPEKKLITGGETVLYRHDKTFVNRTIVAVNIDDDATGEEIDATLAQVRDYVLERVGETLTVEMIGLTQHSTDAASFAALAGKAWQAANRPLILRGLDTKALEEAAKAVAGSGSIVCAHGEEQLEELEKS
jgi:acetyl-CoA decarbonylase/synthase complex subunit gamma